MKLKKINIRDMLSKISVSFFDASIASSLLTLFLVVCGILSYASWLPREGFPSIQFPLTSISVQYFGADAEQVDQEVILPISNAVEDIEGVSEVQTNAFNNAGNVLVFFDDEVQPEEGTQEIVAQIEALNLPEQASVNSTTIKPSLYLNKYDALIAVYSPDSIDHRQVQELAKTAVGDFASSAAIQNAEIVPVFENVPAGSAESRSTVQTSFNQIGVRQDEELNFYDAIAIGVTKSQGTDVIELSEGIQQKIDDLEVDPTFENVDFTISADFASSISTQIQSLENNLITGVIAVAVVSLLLITWRASIMTGLFIGLVTLTTMLILLLVGYTLNTITLFALVLALGLFVDDATIVVEAIDSSKKENSYQVRAAIISAIKRVAPASIAGTLTTVLVFLPLAFVTGVLGEFIRLLPITIIIALMTSLVLSLTILPFIARYVLNNKKPSVHLLGPIEAFIAKASTSGLRRIEKKKRSGYVIGATSVLISLLLVAGSVFIAREVPFNIFPSSADADQLAIQIDFEPNTTIEEAEAIARNAGEIASSTLTPYAELAAYGGFTVPNQRSADLVVELVPFSERDVTSKQLIAQLEDDLMRVEGAKFNVRQIDAGPPAQEMPFNVQIYGDNRQVITEYANEIAAYLDDKELTRMDGSTAEVTQVELQNVEGVSRRGGEQYVQIAAGFNASDTSALVELAEEAVRDEFNAAEVDGVQLSYDSGQESDNAESFAALGKVFPVAIIGILILLAIQFRSVVQPLLIVLAIPFSLFGVFGGLLITNNALSFFSVVGIIGLIGIAVNNTILLTDYANQERIEGASPARAIIQATELRFRPLITTTLTTIVALLPLALTDPFWEPLAFTIIFGLASSTILVIVAFPYYYLMLEKLRLATLNAWHRIRARA